MRATREQRSRELTETVAPFILAGVPRLLLAKSQRDLPLSTTSPVRRLVANEPAKERTASRTPSGKGRKHPGNRPFREQRERSGATLLSVLDRPSEVAEDVPGDPTIVTVHLMRPQFDELLVSRGFGEGCRPLRCLFAKPVSTAVH